MKKIPIRQIRTAQKEQTSSGRFDIRQIQDLLSGQDLIQDLHRHDFFFILALQKGVGTHEIDFTRQNLLNHSVSIMRPGQVHELYLKKGSTGFLMEFNSDFYPPREKLSRQRLRNASNKNFCLLDKRRFEKLQVVLSYIFREYRDKLEGYLDIIKANLDIFFIELIRQTQSIENLSKNSSLYIQERFEELIELLDTHLTTHKLPSQYADFMNLSVYQLNEITKSTVGKTTSELISEQIILEAKRWLLVTPNQIKDIADQLGYEDPSYFIRFFRKQTGFSPEIFRQNFE